MPRFSLEVLDASRDTEFRIWDSLVDQAPVSDVYYRPGYALAYREAGTELVCAVVVDAFGFRVLVPLLISRLQSGETEPVAGKVAHSPYGYGGLLPLDSRIPPNREQVAALKAALQSLACSHGVVCAVLRTHPILCQEVWFEGVEDSEDAILLIGNRTVSLDLHAWNEDKQCLASLIENRRRNLGLARRSLKMSWTCGWNEKMRESLGMFQVIYNARMSALEADRFFFFPADYYTALASGLEDRLAIGLAWRDGDPVAGSLFMADCQYAHYHLSATNPIGRELEASTLLINAGASWARQRGCVQLHLGGGVAGEDSLFRFKKSFGGAKFRAATFTVVAANATFNAFCDLPDSRWPFSMYHRRHDRGFV